MKHLGYGRGVFLIIIAQMAIGSGGKEGALEHMASHLRRI